MSLIATRQFIDAGGTEGSLKWAIKDRWLEPYRWRGVYRVVGSAPVLYQPLMGACLAAGNDAFACGLGAAWAYGAPDIAPRLEIATVGRDVRLEGVISRKPRILWPEHITTRHNIPIVSPALCVVQVGRDHPYLSELVASNFSSRGLASFEEMLLALETTDGRGRGSRALRKYLLRELEVPGHEDSPPARALGRALQRAGLGPFDTQFFVDTGEGIVFLDFAWAWAKVGIEYLGQRDHGSTQAQIEKDARRRARLAAVGWTILDAT
jgi:hypothetical protein